MSALSLYPRRSQKPSSLPRVNRKRVTHNALLYAYLLGTIRRTGKPSPSSNGASLSLYTNSTSLGVSSSRKREVVYESAHSKVTARATTRGLTSYSISRICTPSHLQSRTLQPSTQWKSLVETVLGNFINSFQLRVMGFSTSPSTVNL